MMKRWWLWKAEVTRVELVFVLFVLFMFRCFVIQEEESGVDRRFGSLLLSLIVFSHVGVAFSIDVYPCGFFPRRSSFTFYDWSIVFFSEVEVELNIR